MTAIQLRDIMSSPVVAVKLATTARTVLTLSRELGLHHFPVQGRQGLAGMVCVCDLRDASLTTPVEQLMKSNIVTLGQTATARDAASLMMKRCVGSVLVLDGNDVRGIVTRDDLLQTDPATVARIRACRCQYCGSLEHLQLESSGSYCCVDCAERRDEPGAFEGGGGD